MIRVSYEICQNIALQRKSAHMSQQALADKLTELTGEKVSLHMVSTWERGITEPRIGFMPHICHALGCTSYDLYPHSKTYTQRDMRFLEAIQHLSDRQKDILLFMLDDWDGDADTFWEFGLMYAVMDGQERKYIADVGIEQYLAAKRNYPDSITKANGLDVDIELIKKGAKKLDKKREE